MDEFVAYLIKAEGVKVGDSNLMAQTGIFLQELTAAVQGVRQAVYLLLHLAHLGLSLFTRGGG